MVRTLHCVRNFHLIFSQVFKYGIVYLLVFAFFAALIALRKHQYLSQVIYALNSLSSCDIPRSHYSQLLVVQ